MSYICPYCKKNVFVNIGIHLSEHPCKEYKEHLKKTVAQQPLSGSADAPPKLPNYFDPMELDSDKDMGIIKRPSDLGNIR
jgi:hypothetical protein